MQTKALNPQIFAESLCYSVFAGLLLYLVRSGKYLSYVTPRMAPYLYFAAIVMFIWTLASLSRLFRPQYRVRAAHCFVLAIPIILLLLPHTSLSTSALSGNYVNTGSFAGQSMKSTKGIPQKQVPSVNSDISASVGIPTGAPAGSSFEPTSPPSTDMGNEVSLVETTPRQSVDGSTSDTSTQVAQPTDTRDTVTPDTLVDTPKDDYSTDLPGLDTANKKITVSNDNFSKWLSEICTNIKKYQGYTVVMTGYIFKDPEFLKSNEFVPARLMMSCCVADLSPSGLLCKYDKASELKADSWVTVEGTLFIGQYEYDGQKYDDPQINVTKITPAEEVEGYVYPYY